jgi:hypothetical protein
MQCGLVVNGIVSTGSGCVFNQEKRVGTRLKTDLEVRLGHGVRWRMLAKFRRETLHCFEQSAAVGTYLHSPRGHVVDRDAAAVLNMLWKITPGARPRPCGGT